MGKQINQYTKTRDKTNIALLDLMDFDSTDDGGTSYESAKITVEEFLGFIKTNNPTFYSADGQLTTNREVTMAGFEAVFNGGDIVVKPSNLVDDVAFIVRDSENTEKARIGIDNSLSSGYLEIFDNTDSFFRVVDDTVLIASNNTNGFKVGSTYVNSFFKVDCSNGQTTINILNTQNIKTEANQVKVLAGSITFFNSSNILGFQQAIETKRTSFSGSNAGITSIIDNDNAGLVIDAENYKIQSYRYLNSELAYIDGNGKYFGSSLNLNNVPTSTTGLVSGDIWNDSGILKIV